MALPTREAKHAAGAKSRPLLAQALSAALHAGLLAGAAAMTPALGATPEPVDSVANPHLLYPVIAQTAERELDEGDVHPYAGAAWTLSDGSGVADGAGTEGRLGSVAALAPDGRMTMQGPRDNPDPGPMQRAWDDYTTSWSMGPLKDPWGDPQGLDVTHHAMGDDPSQAPGNMLSAQPAAASGVAGTDPVGKGQGSPAQACIPGRRGQSYRGRWAGAPSAPRPATPDKQGPKTPSGRRIAPVPVALSEPVYCDDSWSR